MSTLHAGAASGPPRSTAPVRNVWIVVGAALMAVVFIEAVFAGAMLSGAPWARAAHRLTAMVLTGSTLLAAVAALIALRRRPGGLPLGLTLLGMAATLFAQAALGAMTAKGANLLWLHVPLGVALVGLAGQALAGARRLGEPAASRS
jgi:hypothetical protein